MAKKLSDRILSCSADAAIEAALIAAGLASCGGAYEPEIKGAEAYKQTHATRLSRLMDKFLG